MSRWIYELKARLVYITKFQAGEGCIVKTLSKKKKNKTQRSFQFSGLGLSFPHGCMDLDSVGECHVPYMPHRQPDCPSHST